ncbi:hypothetical protein [Streptomyces sp. NPDC059979]|uniref:hypothetical protein n=1 Tax=unclassified Streptomyces TaxID=2593676 RepID=UPI00365E615B
MLLHTEVMQQHLLVDPDGRRLTGFLDFEPAEPGLTPRSAEPHSPLAEKCW